jgi:hypothetical protein
MNLQHQNQLAQFNSAAIYCVVPPDFIFCEVIYSQWKHQLTLMTIVLAVT